MIWGIAGILAGILLAEVIVQWQAVRVVLAMIENSPLFRTESLPPDPDAEPFSVTTRDGLTIRGFLHRHVESTPRGLIVFCPEFTSNCRSVMLYCSALARAGFHILTFDFRNHGDSDSLPGYAPLHWLTHFEINDLDAVLDYVQQQPDLCELPLGLFGISRGGGAALFAGAIRPEVARVAAEGAFGTEMMMMAHASRWISIATPDFIARMIPRWHVKWTVTLSRWASQRRRKCRYAMLERALPKLSDRPALIIAGMRDTYVLPEVAQEICRLIKQPGALWSVPKAKHNLARSVNPEEYDRRLVEFFSAIDQPKDGVPASLKSGQTSLTGQSTGPPVAS